MSKVVDTSNLALLKNYYGHFNAKQWDSMLSLVDEDLVHEISQGDAQVGKQNFKSFLSLMDKHYDENLDQMTFFTSDSVGHLSAEFICNGIYKVTAEGLPEAKRQTYSIRVGAFFEIKNNKIIRISNHYNMKNWVAQVSK